MKLVFFIPFISVALPALLCSTWKFIILDTLKWCHALCSFTQSPRRLLRVTFAHSLLFKRLEISGYFMYHQVLHFKNSTFCPHSVFMCLVWISEQTAIISLYSINGLVFITETECVYCAVRTVYFPIQH
jgi:hypothetical protein